VTAATLARFRSWEWLDERWATPAILIGLTAVSAVLRTRILHAGFWIDEGISVGIAHHHWTSIPHVLKRDGSPPAYYMLLGLWIRVFGDGERATHLLSVIFALACIPLAFFTARSIFNRTTGVVAAVLVAFDPYLTYYAQETRMYTMEAFLSLLVAWAYVQGILRGSRAWCVGLTFSLAALVYTHNWALFVCAGLAVTTAVVARDRWKSFALVAVGVAVLYAPWLPTLLYQVQHTGAPWSTRPSFHNLILAPGAVLSGDGPLMAFALVGGTGLAAYVRRRDDEDRRIILTLAYTVAFTVLLAWIESQFSPAWTTRYFAVVLGAIIVVAARGLVTAGRLGLIALIAVIFVWTGFSAHPDKENARQLAQQLKPGMHHAELVLTTHPEQVPVLRYYFGPEFRYANTFGFVSDPQVFDWADAVSRLRNTAAKQTENELVDSVGVGENIIVITPVFRDYRAWDAKWTKLVWEKATLWTHILETDPRLDQVQHVSSNEIAAHLNFFKPLQGFVYRRVR